MFCVRKNGCYIIASSFFSKYYLVNRNCIYQLTIFKNPTIKTDFYYKSSPYSEIGRPSVTAKDTN